MEYSGDKQTAFKIWKMKEVIKTATGNLFNHTGILTHAGDYAGKYQQEAFDLLMQGDEFMWTDDSWADIMHDNKGKCYAVIAKGELTSQNAECYYAEIEENDCKAAIKEALTHI